MRWFDASQETEKRIQEKNRPKTRNAKRNRDEDEGKTRIF